MVKKTKVEKVEAFFTAFTKNLIKDTNNNRNTLINWKFPLTSRIKINTDGSFIDNGQASFGGIARDDQRKWLEGLCSRIDYTSPLKGIYAKASRLQKKRGLHKVIIKTNSQVALEFIEIGDVDNHTDCIIVQDRKAIKRQVDANIIYMLREENQISATLTKIGIN